MAQAKENFPMLDKGQPAEESIVTLILKRKYIEETLKLWKYFPNFFLIALYATFQYNKVLTFFTLAMNKNAGKT